MVKVLLVEDDKHLLRVLEIALEREGYEVDGYRTGDSGHRAGLEGDHDIIVLDLSLPVMTGFDICGSLRRHGVNLPILMITGLDDTQSRVTALDSGADDYVTKPFNLDEFFARIRALLRRKNNDSQSGLVLADLEMSYTRHEVKRNNQVINLMPKEYVLLEYMLRNKNRALSREQILQHVWGVNGQHSSNRIDVYVKHLRRKIDEPFTVNLLHTVRGIGYKLSLDP